MGGGIASDWLVRRFSLRTVRCILPFFAMAITSVLLIAGSRAEQARTAGIVLALGAGILYIALSCFWDITADFAGEYAGLASGIMNMGAQVWWRRCHLPHAIPRQSPGMADGVFHCGRSGRNRCTAVVASRSHTKPHLSRQCSRTHAPLELVRCTTTTQVKDRPGCK